MEIYGLPVYEYEFEMKGDFSLSNVFDKQMMTVKIPIPRRGITRRVELLVKGIDKMAIYTLDNGATEVDVDFVVSEQ